MSKIKCAVIGVGYLGRFHAQKYHELANAKLVGVCDIDVAACAKVAHELGVHAYFDYRDLFGMVDAVSIAATTVAHYAIASACLAHGIHVLIEKPITETVSQADHLISLAKKHGCKLQVGHLERFNAARLALDTHIEKPLFIESQRLAPFIIRGTDVNVILDLMIHDIDLIQALVKSPIRNIDAQGTPVLSKHIDIANARISFENNCVANITSSRISFKTERKMRIFQANNYISIDYHKKTFAIFSKSSTKTPSDLAEITRHESVFAQSDALLAQIASFVNCIVYDTPPLVSGGDGRAALDTAQRISTLIDEHLMQSYVSC